MFDTFLSFPRYCKYERKKSVFNEAFVEQNVQQNRDDFAQECLRVHNHYRAQHGCPPLHLSYSVCAISQEWANRISAEDHFHHSSHPQYGENLFVTYMSNNSLPTVTAQQVVESWYSEHVFYPFDGHITRDTLSKASHFSQVIWRSSRELGIGSAVSKNNRFYVVANYYPAGNVLRQFAENVPHKIHNYSHLPSYYNRRISSRRMYTDTTSANLHVPQYKRASSRHLDTDYEIPTGTLHAPHHYARKVSSRQPDTAFEISTGNLQIPHHYARKVSTKRLDALTKFSNVPHCYNTKNSSDYIDNYDSSAETLHVPQYHTRRNSSKRLDIDDLIGNQFSPRSNNNASDSSSETLHVPQYSTRRTSSKRLDVECSFASLFAPCHNNRRASHRQYNFDDSTESLHIPQYYSRRAPSGRLANDTEN